MAQPLPKRPRTGEAALFRAAAAEKFCARKHGAMLGLTRVAPIAPERPTANDIIAGKAIQPWAWIVEVQKSVVWRLSVHQFEGPDKLRTPLYMQRTPAFNATKTTAATTWKEPWDQTNCLKSLQQNAFYEASMTLWQFLAAAKEWNGTDLAVEAISWPQYDACLGLWSQAVLDSSSDNVDQARFIFPGFVPTCVKSLGVIEQMVKANCFFRDLPACGGQAVMWSLIGALDSALKNKDNLLILKLYEASVTITVRMRLMPSTAQIQLDQMAYIDVLRIKNLACGAASFFEFALSVLRFDHISGIESCPELLKKLETLGVQYQGKPINRSVAYSILSVVGVADTGVTKDAVRYLERIYPGMWSEHSKLQRAFQNFKKYCEPEEYQDCLVALMESIGVALLSGNKGPEDLSTILLVPEVRRGAGYVRGLITKRKFFKWFLDEQISTAASGASSAVSVVGLSAIKEACLSPRKFWRQYQDDPEQLVDDEPTMFEATQRKFGDFIEQNLRLAGDKKAADLILKLMTHRFDDEFIDIASGSETFAAMFAGRQPGDPQAVKTLLAAELQAFKCCMRDVPVSATGGSDRPREATPGDEGAAHIANIYEQVTSARKKKIQFISSNMLTTNEFWKKGGQATSILQRSKFTSTTGEPGKDHSLILLCAEMFPSREGFLSATPHRDPLLPTADLKAAAKWAMAAQGGNTVVVLADGRSKKVRRVFEDIVEEYQSDEQKHFDFCIVYSSIIRNDIRFPTRKTFGGLANLEKLCGALPVSKVRMISKERTHFSACGEKSTHSSSYSGVPIREVGRLPRLSMQDKEGIVGSPLPTYGDSVIATTGVKGHPLFWNEIKDVEVFVALYQDLNVSHVFDMCSGSAAAAMAAGICDIGYDGLAINTEHATWLNRLMDKAMFAILADRTDDESTQLRSDLATYFGTSIEEARQLLSVDGDAGDGGVDGDGGDNEGGA